MSIKTCFTNFLVGLLFFHTSLSAKDVNIPQAECVRTQTPIKYLVVIYAGNCTFDRLFATYPYALNPPGEPEFKPKPNTPSVNGISKSLILHNNNLIAPFRLSREQSFTCNPEEGYSVYQLEAHAGLLDQFCQFNPNCPDVMGYYDGNTVTALWNYAQRFAMSDNFHSTVMSQTNPGHINLISGQTHGVTPPNLQEEGKIVTIDGTLIANANPTFDKCSLGTTVHFAGRNVGNLLNAKDVTWGWFSGGFRNCDQTHLNSQGQPLKDYVPTHEPFQYYSSTSNAEHLTPSSPALIGYQDRANHQYDLTDFWTAAENHNIPAVSFLKPPNYQNGHPGESDILDLQMFLVETINRLQKLPEWNKMAILIAWDDSGGVYDHDMPPIINQSQTQADALVSPGNAGSNPPLGGYQARFAYGMRLPFLIISPFAKTNYVDHTLTDQTSILRFIEDNWNLGRIGDFSFDELAGSLEGFFNFSNINNKPLILDPSTGLVNKKKKKFRPQRTSRNFQD